MLRKVLDTYQNVYQKTLLTDDTKKTIGFYKSAYYQYVLVHPVEKWDIPTAILYGGKDNLQSLDVVENFVEEFGCKLTVAEDSEHSFMDDGEIVKVWLQKNI